MEQLGALGLPSDQIERMCAPVRALGDDLLAAERQTKVVRGELRALGSRCHDLEQETTSHRRAADIAADAAADAARASRERRGLDGAFARALSTLCERTEADAACLITAGLRVRDRSGAALDMSGSGVVDVSRACVQGVFFFFFFFFFFCLFVCRILTQKLQIFLTMPVTQRGPPC
jgi:hypothetical protein